MTDTFPRVLFFTSEVPQSVNAGSMQLFRALKDYPPEKIMVAGMAPDPRATRLDCRYEPVPLVTYRLACTRFRRWTIGINALNSVYEPEVARSIRLVQPFAPEVVVTVMDKLSYFKHAWALARRLRVPLLAITMDDPQTFESSHPLFENAYARILRRIYSDAAISLGVSQEMCEYIAGRFGKQSEVFYFGPPEGIQSRRPDDSQNLKRGDALTMGYAGSMSLGYREGILAILPALEATQTRLHVYTKDQHLLIEHPNIINRGFFSPEQLWPAVQAECDAVLLPYSFASDIGRVYRTHFPTKLSEYCWTGMPIVLSGPDYGTGIRWGLRNPDAAATAVGPAPTALIEILAELRRDPAKRVALARGASQLALTDFEPVAIKARFVDFLRRAASRRAQD